MQTAWDDIRDLIDAADTDALDPDILVTRLREYEAAGADPLPADLQQALVRLPRGPHPSAAAGASALRSEAARTAARWLSGPGLPAPKTGIRWRHFDGPMAYYLDERPPLPDARLLPVPSLKAERTGLPLIDDLLKVRKERPEDHDHDGHMDWWPSLLPFHREVVAAHLVPHVLVRRGPAVRPSHVMKLARAGGEVGPAMALLLAYFLGEPGDDVPALVPTAASGTLPTAQVGNHLALLLRWTSLNPQHVANALRTAADHGAHREVWDVLRSLMAALLPWAAQQPQPRKGLAKIAKAAVEAAAWTEARGEIPEVATAGKNKTVFVRECRRLHEYLTRT